MEIKTSFITIGEGDNPTKSLLSTLYQYDEEGNLTYEPTEDDKWDLIRRLRDELLTQSDWVVIKASEEGTTVPANWTAYRQALRDLPQVFNTPEEVVLPDMPS
jgi:NADH:ubiquinone oxidoreductase subunit